MKESRVSYFDVNDDGLATFNDGVADAVRAAFQRGEEKATSQRPEVLAESTAAELRAVGVEPDLQELVAHYRERPAGQ